MYFEQFYLGCLAHASYLFGSDGQAAVVDPQRDVEIYIEAAKKQGLQIRYIFETHLHADFVSGHNELAARTGANIYIGKAAQATFPHIGMEDGSQVHVGRARVTALATPGHTQESMCFLITDEENPDKPYAVLTGDTLFIGDVGRPDLSKSYTPQQLAGMLYDSLHQKLMTLPNEVLVYPAHGAGSLCGRNMRAERSSTIGTERLTNYALQVKDSEEFVRQMTSNLPARPDYFLEDAAINRAGASALGDLPDLAPITASALKARIQGGDIALDVRAADDFAAGHIPGSINIALSGQFASWAGAVLGLSSQPVLIAANEDQISEARMRLARVGIEQISGYLEGGMETWKQPGFELVQMPQVTVEELRRRLDTGDLKVLDVRRQGEWDAGHIEGADWCPLDRFKTGLPILTEATTTAVHCKSGYRSMIAASLLQRAGHNVVNVIGGYDAWEQVEQPKPAEAEVRA
jgi:hydroxyacylglutathione hydrolase